MAWLTVPPSVPSDEVVSVRPVKVRVSSVAWLTVPPSVPSLCVVSVRPVKVRFSSVAWLTVPLSASVRFSVSSVDLSSWKFRVSRVSAFDCFASPAEPTP